MKTKNFYFQMEVKQVEDTQGAVIIEGFASTPDIDRYRDIVEPMAFQNALELYMKNPVLLYQHNGDMPVGNIISAIITDKGLRIRAEIKDEDTKEKVLDGRMRALSIGYIPLNSELRHEDGTPFNIEKDDPWDSDLIRVIKELDLVEISIVTTPANGNALFTIAKSVKQFFNKLVTKEFASTKENLPDNEMPDNEAENGSNSNENTENDTNTELEKENATEEEITPKTDAVEPVVEKEEESEEEKKKNPENMDGDEEEEENDEDLGKGKDKKEIETESDSNISNEETQKGGENDAEIASPEKPEAEISEAGTSEPIKEEESKEDVEEDEEKQAVLVDKKTAELLPELVQAGFVIESDSSKALVLPKSFIEMVKKILENTKSVLEENELLTEKLNKIPSKQSLSYSSGQFSEEKSMSEEEKKKQKSKSVLSALFGKDAENLIN